MATEVKKEIALEIAHVLFIDIVGYSKLLINEQRELLEELNQIVRGTESFRAAESAGKLICLPTGDGMALVFSTTPETPVECALEISRALKSRPHLQVRMGVHSGPVSGILDVNDRVNVAGAGINMAQRVMDCGDAGHILLSKRVAEDLGQYRQWKEHLHELGECDVKHDVRVSVVNLFTDELGNATVPQKFKEVAQPKQQVVTSAVKPTRFPWHEIVIAVLLIAAVIAGVVMFRMIGTARKAVTTAVAKDSGQAGTLVPKKSVAVLPFENLSEDKANAFFADGVQDEILTNLAKIADLRVISRTSVMQYKGGVARNLREIGQQLGVAHLLEGSVQRAANKIRVNAQLIDARTDAHLWAQTYDRDLADIFAIQSEIAKAIADQLQAKLSPNEKAAMEQPPTTDMSAFDLYTRAKTLLIQTSFSTIAAARLMEAATLLNQAIARDPQFFMAYCQLAYTHDNLYFLGFDHTPARLALAQTAVDTASRLRPAAGEAHLARAEHFYRGYLDYDQALVELGVARKTLPNDPRIFELTGYIMRRRGNHDAGLQQLEHAIELDPRNAFTLQQVGLSYLYLRRYDGAISALDRALAINPADSDTKVIRALLEWYRNGDTRPLHHTIDSIRRENPSAVGSVADNWLFCALAERDASAANDALKALGENTFGNDAIQFDRNFGEGLIARMMKDEVKARTAFAAARTEQEKQVHAQRDYGPPLSVLGLIDAALGRKEQALQEGRRAIELLPVEKESINGAHVIEHFAIIAAWVGEKDLAIENLEKAVRLPGTVSYGQLKTLPFWDPLRGDPRFEKIVASLAPK